MKLDFTDKVVVITGAGSGMGAEAAMTFAELGAKVVVNDYNPSYDIVDRIREKGKEAIYVVGDVSDESVVSNIIKTAIDTYGKIDVLINHAAVVPKGTIEDFTTEAWDRTMKVNVGSVFLMSKYAVPYMKENGGGVIINTASNRGIKGYKQRAVYTATKGAVLAMTRQMAADYVDYNIRVNSISPGVIDSPSFRGRFDEEKGAAELQRSFKDEPMNRFGTMSEIVAVMLFLAWDQNSFLTGENIVSDGGAHSIG